MADCKVYSDLIDIVEAELKKLVKKGELNASETSAAKDAVSCILKSMELKDKKEMEEELAQRGYSYGDDPYRRWEILSYGGRNMPRMSMASRRDDMSRGYSHHSIKDRAISRLETMMDEAGSEYEREKVREFIRRLEMISE